MSDKDKKFWSFFIILALALCLWGYFHPYARLGFSLLPILLCANYKTIKAEWQKGIPKWILYLWLVLLISAITHLAYSWQLTDAMGVLLIILCFGVYLLARTMSKELRVWLSYLAIVGSITLIANRLYDQSTWIPGVLGIFHASAFAILIGLILAPKRIRLWVGLFGIPAIVMSGSEEGIVALILLLAYALITKKLSKREIIPLGAVCLIAIPLITSGWAEHIYPRLNADRFVPDITTLSNKRWEGYIDLYHNPKVWLLGEGWYWNTEGSREAWQINFFPLWATVHNAPMRIAAQFGILAGLSWLLLFILAFIKLPKYRAVFIVILWFGMIDHFMWTSAIAWPWLILGITDRQEAPVQQEEYIYACKTGDSVASCPTA